MSKELILQSVGGECLRDDIPEIAPGDTVVAHLKISEGGKERIQRFEGTCIAVKNGGVAKNVTLRKISDGIGVERTIPVHSPLVEKFEVLRHAKVRRAKLYYLRDKVGKASRLKERR